MFDSDYTILLSVKMVTVSVNSWRNSAERQNTYWSLNNCSLPSFTTSNQLVAVNGKEVLGTDFQTSCVRKSISKVTFLLFYSSTWQHQQHNSSFTALFLQLLHYGICQSRWEKTNLFWRPCLFVLSFRCREVWEVLVVIHYDTTHQVRLLSGWYHVVWSQHTI